MTWVAVRVYGQLARRQVLLPSHAGGGQPVLRQAGQGKGRGMDFVFVCGWCDEECVVFCPRTGFWGNRFEDPEEFDCWSCGGTSTTPYSPWTPAD